MLIELQISPALKVPLLERLRQIDVYWEFEFGGLKYKTVIQAKDHAQNINMGGSVNRFVSKVESRRDPSCELY